MTRINCVYVGHLSPQHLVGEYRELPRVFTLVKNAVSRDMSPSDFTVYDTYTMGPGHVKFFYTRLEWLVRRYESLQKEMRRRGYKPTPVDTCDLVGDLQSGWFGFWLPTNRDLDVSRRRLAERARGDGQYRQRMLQGVLATASPMYSPDHQD